MSLVEQAIARMRKQAPAAAPAAPSPSVEPLRGPAPKSAKRMTLNMDALRTRGYLPEAATDRQFADHYRRIKQPLIDRAFSGGEGIGEPLVIMITSALPGDGKTFTSINLALSMALERDFSVLLIDCDVAKRQVSDVVGLREETGLLNALVDDALDVESLIVQTDLRGLSILPAGRRVEAAAELLSSNRMQQIVANLSKRDPSRILLLDSPPLLITNEGRTLVKMARQIVLVVRAGYTPRQAVQEALGLFDPQQAGGIILNELQVSRLEGYYGYDSYGTTGDAT